MSSSPEHDRMITPYGIRCVDIGWIYMVRNGGFLKIGRSRNPTKRLTEGRTWLPDMEVLHVKPFWNITHVERCLHEGLARCWHSNEWHCIKEDCDCNFMIEAFAEFGDEHRDRNSIDWIYWMNSTGFADFCIEIREQNKTLPAFRRQESGSRGR